MIAGIWGTLAVTFTSAGEVNQLGEPIQFHIQLMGIAAVGGFVFGSAFTVWWALDRVLGVRISRQVEELGQDVAELGMESYPEFILMPEEFDDDEEEEPRKANALA